MNNIAIKIEKVSKQYRLGQIGTGTISHDLNRWWHQVRGKDNPYLKVGENNDRSKKGDSEYVWALQDINIEVQQGEILGIIGKNGAGKSTLLKILSKVTGPTTGNIKAQGRLASLLEVGTGFHPEMTGRENIYMNGTIMGMNRHEISSKLDEIVAFAGIERYIDSPVKRYSSGMTVRLGFSIAAHLEPEILVVDEVLAVGDAEFQKKAIGKMQDVSKGEGRTVLFVSHNMASIKALCTRSIVLKNGMINFDGGTPEAIAHYQSIYDFNDVTSKKWEIEDAIGNNQVKLLSIDISPLKGQIIDISSGFKIRYSIYNYTSDASLGTTIEIINKDGVLIIHTGRVINSKSKKGVYTVEFNMPGFLLNTNYYSINLIFGHSGRLVLSIEDVLQFFIENSEVNGTSLKLPGLLRLNTEIKSSFKLQ